LFENHITIDQDKCVISKEAEVQFARPGGVVLVCLLVSLARADSPRTIVADFESYPEGTSFKPSFLDSQSGIFFTNSTAFSHNFVIEYATSTTSTDPIYSNNKYLVANGFAPGNGASLPGNFGFTGNLPGPANHISIDVGIIQNGPAACTVILSGYDMQDQLLDSDASSLTTPAPFGQRHLEVDSSGFEMLRFVLAVDHCSTGYDNITAVIVPEPGSAMLVVGGGLLLRRYRRQFHV